MIILKVINNIHLPDFFLYFYRMIIEHNTEDQYLNNHGKILLSDFFIY